MNTHRFAKLVLQSISVQEQIAKALFKRALLDSGFCSLTLLCLNIGIDAAHSLVNGRLPIAQIRDPVFDSCDASQKLNVRRILRIPVGLEGSK